MEQLSQQFLQFNQSREIGVVSPIAFEKDFSFFLSHSSSVFHGFEVLTPNGDLLFQYSLPFSTEKTICATLSEDFFSQAKKTIAVGDYFRFSPILLNNGEESVIIEISGENDFENYIKDYSCDTSKKMIYTGITDLIEESAFVVYESKVLLRGEEIASHVVRGCENLSGKIAWYEKGAMPTMQIVLDEEIADFSGAHEFYILKKTYTKSEEKIFSSVLQRVNRTDFSHVQYRCTNSEFGFPFGEVAGSWVRCWLPIKLSKPQFSQSDKTYTKRTGEVVVLYAEITKEYDATTDYVDADFHEKIVTALSCDELLIDDEPFYKSDKYNIEWDNHSFDERGAKVAMATFKVKSSIMKRNSNC